MQSSEISQIIWAKVLFTLYVDYREIRHLQLVCSFCVI